MARSKKREEIQLPRRVAELPVQHLQLTDATARAAARMRTIGTAAKHLEDKESVQLWKTTARKELRSALADLRGCVRRDGTVDLARFYALRPARNTCGAMYYVSEQLEGWIARQGNIS